MKVSEGSNQKQQRKSGNTIFSIISLWGYFLHSRAANSVVGGPILPKFELIHNIMHVLVTSKFEKDRININGDYVMTLIILCMSSLPASLKRIGSIATEKKWWCQFFRRSRAANSIVSGGIWPKFKLIQAFMHVLITCKYEKDPIKNSRENVMT